MNLPAPTTAGSPSDAGRAPPLCVDLDGTLVPGDTLFETTLALIRRNPAYVALFPAWLARGRAYFKAQVAQRVELDAAHWPYRPELVGLLRRERERGRYLVLATGSDERVARAAAAHLALFDEVHASDGATNLKGGTKAQRLVERFGAGNFVYAGDSFADLPVWRAAGGAIVVSASAALASRVAAFVPLEARLDAATDRRRALIRLARPHQWVKNLLLLLPLVTAHRIGDPAAWLQALTAMVAMCLASSAAYACNDALDLAADRSHRTKRDRPLASGTVGVPAVAAFAATLMLAAAIVASMLPAPFLAGTTVYLAAALAYSLGLKRVVGLDVAMLAALYVLRVMLGAVAIGVAPSAWLLSFVGLLFASLALLKRYAELQDATRTGLARLPGRGWRTGHRGAVLAVGVAAGALAVLVLLAYALGAEAARHYANPRWLLALAPLLGVWLLRAWHAGRAGAMHADPLVYALREPASYAVVAGMLAAMVFAK